MELHQVRYFLAVCETLNFTRAAERCSVSQPALTRAIRNLEDEFGGQLIRRERSNSHLTELGQLVRPYLEDVYRRSQEATEIARSFKKDLRPRLRIGVMCTIAGAQSNQLLSHLGESIPTLRLDIVDGTQGETLDSLVKGDIDVAFMSMVGREDDDKFHTVPLFRERVMIIVSPSHPLASRDAVRVKDLAGQRYIMRSDCELDAPAGMIFASQGVVPEVVHRSNRDDWIQSMVAAGLGYGFFPERSITQLGLAVRPLVEPEIWRDTGLVTVRRRASPPIVTALVREAGRVDWNAWRPVQDDYAGSISAV
jgi:DNA-binding transcriptional LysR family regulator